MLSSSARPIRRGRRSLYSLAAILLLAFTVTVATGCEEAEPFALDGTAWRLIEWAEPGQEPSEFDIELRFENGRAKGQAPVNVYTTSITESSNGALLIGDLHQTLKAGNPESMHAEETYLDLLDDVREYRLDGDTLTLIGEGGDELLVFTRLKQAG
jgi:heat shock protein HslJ